MANQPTPITPSATAEVRDDILVARQPGSKQFGIYINGKLIEGGFFSQAVAYEAAERERKTSPIRSGQRSLRRSSRCNRQSRG